MVHRLIFWYSWFHIKGTWSVHSFYGDYIYLFLVHTGSSGYLFHEILRMWLVQNRSEVSRQWLTHKVYSIMWLVQKQSLTILLGWAFSRRDWSSNMWLVQNWCDWAVIGRQINILACDWFKTDLRLSLYSDWLTNVYSVMWLVQSLCDRVVIGPQIELWYVIGSKQFWGCL